MGSQLYSHGNLHRNVAWVPIRVYNNMQYCIVFLWNGQQWMLHSLNALHYGRFVEYVCAYKLS